MTSIAHETHAAAPAGNRGHQPQPAVARAVLVNALLLGVAGDSLLRDGPSGVALPLWVGVVVLNLVALVWKAGRGVARPAAAWLAAAFVFSLGLAWRNAETLQAFDLLATAACLAMAALTISGRIAHLTRTKIFDLARATVGAAASVAAGFLPPLMSVLSNRDRVERSSDRFTVGIRAAILTTLLLFIFGALLRSADPIFASIVSIPQFDVGVFIGHVVFTTFLAWLVAGWVRSAVLRPEEPMPSSVAIPRIGLTEITTALGALNVLFAMYVATQVVWFFGGEGYLRAHTGLTAAEYARSGFFQMVWVVTLVLPVLLGTRALAAPSRAIARRHTTLAVPLLALLAVMVLSATLRLKMYVHFYGLTTDRFYPLVFMAWVSFVLMWLAGTVLVNRRGFLAGSLVSGFAVLAALNALDPDALIARVNVDRAAHLGADKLDIAHLATLRGGAVPLATSVVLDSRYGADASQRCGASVELLKRWDVKTYARRNDATAWRFWNADDALAMRTVSSHLRELRAINHAACAAARAAARAKPSTAQR